MRRPGLRAAALVPGAVLVVVAAARALAPVLQARHGARGADRVAPAGARVEVLAETGEVVFGRGRVGREPRVGERLLGGKSPRGIGV